MLHMLRTHTNRLQICRRHLAVASGVLAPVLLLAGLLTASPATAVPGIVSDTDDTNSMDYGPATSKTMTAECPEGTKIIGGGGGLLGNQVGDGLVITQLQPIDPIFLGEDRFTVTVEDPSGTVRDWGVRATAICAPALPNMSIEYGFTPLSSDPAQLATATCPSGRKVVGSGGTVYEADGHAGLQVMRASTDGRRVYAQAHEEPGGYSGSWYVFAWAVCATAPSGYAIVMGQSPQEDSETTKSATADCPGSKTLLGAGAATTFSAPAEVALHFAHAYSYPTSGSVSAYAAENEWTLVDWDFMVAQAICAN